MDPTKLTREHEARKARLEALRARKAGGPGAGGATGLLSQRNFDPESRTLKKHAQVEDNIEDTIEKNVQGMAALIIKEDEERRAQELDIFNIAPRRPNWDLKRDTYKKVALLERKTQEAIHTLIRQRLAAQKGLDGDLVGAMNAEQQDRQGSDDEDDEE